MFDAINALVKRRAELDSKVNSATEGVTSAKALLGTREAQLAEHKKSLDEVDAALKKLGHQPAPPAPAQDAKQPVEAKAEPKAPQADKA